MQQEGERIERSAHPIASRAPLSSNNSLFIIFFWVVKHNAGCFECACGLPWGHCYQGSYLQPFQERTHGEFGDLQ